MVGKRKGTPVANAGVTRRDTHVTNAEDTRRNTPVTNVGFTKAKTPPSHAGREQPVNESRNNQANSGQKIHKATDHKDRVPRAETPVHGSKTMQEHVDKLDKTHQHVHHSKLPRAIHKPSTLAIIERRHSYTSGEKTQPKQNASENLEYTFHEIEKMVKKELNSIQMKINCLKENLFKCSRGIDVIQREQSEIFHRYEVYLDRCTPCREGKKQRGEGVSFPPLSQKTSLVSNGVNPESLEDADKSSMISNIKKIARKRSNELALREELLNENQASYEKRAVTQTLSSEEIRKSARIKAREAVRRAAEYHFRQRENSASQPTENQEVLKQETIHKGESKIAQILRAHDKITKVGKVSKGHKK